MKNCCFWFFFFIGVPAFALQIFHTSSSLPKKRTPASSIWKIADSMVIPGTRFPSFPLSRARGFFIRPTLFVTSFHVVKHSFYKTSNSRWKQTQMKKEGQALTIKNIVRVSAIHDLALVETEEATDSHMKLRADSWNPTNAIFIPDYSNERRTIEKTGDIIELPSGEFGFFSNHYFPVGRSGSPVIDRFGKVVGVLHGGIDNFLIVIHHKDLQAFIDGNTGTNCTGKNTNDCFAEEMEKTYELAEQGSVLANRMLGVHISDSGNHEESRYWMHKAAEAGDLMAQFLMALQAIPRHRALHWLWKAAERNFPPAQYKLARFLLKEPVIRFSPQEQREKAVELLKLSAASGYTPSLKQLSKLHKRGILVEKNKPQALQLYQQVTEQYNLPFHYYLTGNAIRNKCQSLFSQEL